MALFEWNEKYSVGVERFNEQHKRLFELMNALHDSVRKGHSRSVLDDAFQQMIDYTERHLAEEEALMKSVRFPGFEDHRGEHENLRSELQSFRRKYQEGQSTIGIDLLNFLLRWWTDHILKTDRGYKGFLYARDL